MTESFSLEIASMPFDEHHCTAAAISCIDFRFLEADQQCIKKQTNGNFDHIKVAGAGKNFVTDNPLRVELFATIRNVCIKLHGITELIVLNHWDCGAYGSSKSFSSPAAQEERYIEDLTKAREILAAEFPSLTIIVGYSRLSGTRLEYKFL